jgi:hypothetical protein
MFSSIGNLSLLSTLLILSPVEFSSGRNLSGGKVWRTLFLPAVL